MEILDEGFVEFELGWVVDLVEFDDEVGVEMHENGNAVDQSLHYFECALGLDDRGFAQRLFEVVYDFIVPLLCLLGILTLRFHYF